MTKLIDFINIPYAKKSKNTAGFEDFPKSIIFVV